MKELPILFTGKMVRAIQELRKTETRRIVRIDDTPILSNKGHYQRGIPSNAQNVRLLGDYLKCDAPPGSTTISARVLFPYGDICDRLWVRERMRVVQIGDGRVKVVYEADDVESDWIDYPDRLARPKIGKCLAYGGHREGSRLTLEVTKRGAQRVQSITEEGAQAEGVDLWGTDPWLWPDRGPGQGKCAADSYRASFAVLWDSINGKRAAWATNPWVWVVGFRLLTGQHNAETETIRAMAFKTEYTGSFVGDPKLSKAFEIWLRYFNDTEAYDQTVCSRRDERGIAIPANTDEGRLINQNVQVRMRKAHEEVAHSAIEERVSQQAKELALREHERTWKPSH